MNDKNNFKSVAPGVEIHYPEFNIDELLKTTKNSDQWYEAKVGGTQEEYFGRVESSHRTCMAHDMPYNLSGRVEWYRLGQMLLKHGKEYCDRNDIDFFSAIETPQMLHYRAGEGFYNKHVDHMLINPRIFSAVYYLNDVAEGGETYFPNFDLSIRPEKGTLAIFPSNYVYIHEARPPISNDKYVVVAWYQE